MAGPVVVECPQNTWTKVASGVVEGIVDRIQTGYSYYQTYRRSGQATPTDPIGTEVPTGSVQMFTQAPQEHIASSVPIDVYVLTQVKDQKISAPGKVRVSM